MNSRTASLALCLVAVAASSASARFARPQDVPVERLLANTAAYIKEHPKDAQGYYLHARVHALAFVLKRQSIGTWGAGDAKTLPNIADIFLGPGDPANAPSDAQASAHLKGAIEYFGKAIAMEPKNGLFRLGLAYVLETGGVQTAVTPPLAADLPTLSEGETRGLTGLITNLGSNDFATREAAENELRKAGVKAAPILLANTNHADAETKSRVLTLIRGLWREQAITTYLDAHRLASAEDAKIGNQPIHGLRSLVSYEAGESYLRLVKSRPQSDAESKAIAEVEKQITLLNNKPRGPVTPIIFSLAGAGSTASLLDETRTVKFDLDGSQRGQTWPWVKADTSILVWDPRGTGQVTSGLQLFGTVTWWMFWRDGYHALDALDDNRDGVLSGAELRGLAVWRDRDGNGVSDAGEVLPVSLCGITAISTRADHTDRGGPACRRGVRLSDGRSVASFDWLVEPVPTVIVGPIARR